MNRLERNLRVVVDDEAPARESIESLLATDSDVELCGSVGDGRTAISVIETESPDLVFLDVQMPEMDGFELLRELRRRRASNPLPFVILVTAYDRFALQAFEVHAVDFLLKPFGDARFYRALHHAKTMIEAGALQHLALELLLSRDEAAAPSPDRFTLRMGSSVKVVPIADICWFEASDHYVFVHIGTESHLIRKAMKELAAELDSHHFARIHRGAIVNLRHVETLRLLPRGKGELTLSTGIRLPVSRRRLSALKRMLDTSSRG